MRTSTEGGGPTESRGGPRSGLAGEGGEGGGGRADVAGDWERGRRRVSSSAGVCGWICLLYNTDAAEV